MLVLTRKLQEQIKIGDDVVITILRIKGQSVRIGIDAPKGVRVLRSELPDARPPAPEVTTVELNPFALPTATPAAVTTQTAASRPAVASQPLGSRLRGRRAPSARLAAVTRTQGRLGPAMAAVASC